MHKLIIILLSMVLFMPLTMDAQMPIKRQSKKTEQTTGPKATKHNPTKKSNNPTKRDSNDNMSSLNMSQESVEPTELTPLGPGPIIQNLINNMVYVEGGSFMMGFDDDDALEEEKPIHKESVESFSIGKYEVTQKEWETIMGSNPSELIGDDLPVTNVSWFDCQEFIKKLNILTGYNFRLPSEIEWEYAARGGNQSHAYKYSGSNDINEVAWNESNSGYKTHVVGTKNSNELGLHDMSGNVDEWTSSKWGQNSGEHHSTFFVVRGGCAAETPFGDISCRVSFRWDASPYYSNWVQGLRLAF